MTKILKAIESIPDHSIIIFGVVLAAVALMFNSSGVIQMMVITYGIREEYLGIGIIVGLLIEILARGSLTLRIIGVLPYTIFVVLAELLWINGTTQLVQSQIYFAVFWVIIVRPVLVDGIKEMVARSHVENHL